MLRCHYTQKPFKFDKNKTYSIYSQALGKPDGLWYDVDGSWLEFCRTEFTAELKRIKHRYAIELNTRNVLKITNPDSFREFTIRYSTVRDRNMGHLSPSRFFEIDWLRVQNDFAGIEIAPYLHMFRLDPKTSWYYSWDCACGIVWKISVVRSVVEIPLDTGD